MLGHHRPKVAGVVGIATQGLHQHRNARLVLHDQIQHDLVQIWPIISAVALREVNHMRFRLLRTIVAAIHMETGALEMRKRGG